MTPYLLAVILSVLCYACKVATDNIETNQSEASSQSSAKTQAILLTQSFDYDPADKNRVTGQYQAQTKITVPQDLASQNKWIMFEGPVLENDVVAYRYYADSRHRFDIYGKLVPDLVMDTVSWQYHDIMDWGADILKVGSSLGMGSPAIYFNDSIYTLSFCDQKEIEVLQSSDTRSTIRTTFKGLTIEDKKIDLIQDWSLAEGEAWSSITLKVMGESLPKGMRFATGFVKHLPEIIQGNNQGIFYAMNWGKQSFHKEGLGMAIMAKAENQPKQIMDDLSHAYYFDNASTEVTYQFMSVWERDKNNVKDTKGMKQLIEKATASLN